MVSKLMAHHTDAGPQLAEAILPHYYLSSTQNLTPLWHDVLLLLLVMFFILREKLNLQYSCRLFTNITSLFLNI